MVTWPMTSRDPERSNLWPEYDQSAISRKRLEIETQFQRTASRKWPIGYQIVTWPITSRDTQRCCEAVRSVILATAWLLVLLHICKWSWAECNSDTSILSIYPSITLQYCDKMAKQGCPIDHHTGFLGEKYELLMGTASTKACTHWPQNVYNSPNISSTAQDAFSTA